MKLSQYFAFWHFLINFGGLTGKIKKMKEFEPTRYVLETVATGRRFADGGWALIDALEARGFQVPKDVIVTGYDDILQEFFDAHPDVHHCITMCSKAHLVGEFLLRTNRKNIQIMGYDMVGKNAECLRQGSISFLIAQHAFMQGYNCIDTLFKAIILKQEVSPVNYMPIELLSRENVEFYRRTQL